MHQLREFSICCVIEQNRRSANYIVFILISKSVHLYLSCVVFLAFVLIDNNNNNNNDFISIALFHVKHAQLR